MRSAVRAAVVLDTMVVSALLHPDPRNSAAQSYRGLIDGRPAVVSFVTVTELRYGALKARWGQLRRYGLERDLRRFAVVQPDDELMRRCASLRASCEQTGHALGQKMHEADRWVAATALRLRVPLVADDGIYRNVAGLDVLSRDG